MAASLAEAQETSTTLEGKIEDLTKNLDAAKGDLAKVSETGPRTIGTNEPHGWHGRPVASSEQTPPNKPSKSF